MTAQDSAGQYSFAKQWHRHWGYVLDIGLTIWVLRAPIIGLGLGYVILWLTPQAQDLFVDLATADLRSWVRFLAILILVWAAPTEYAAQILITTDERYCQSINQGRDRCRHWLQAWSPRILGALVFVCILGAVVRSSANVPSLVEADYTLFVKARLSLFASVLFGFLVVFWCYVLARPRLARTRIVRLAEVSAEHILRPLRRRLPPIFGLHRSASGRGEIKSDLGPLLLIIMFFLFAALPTAFPFLFATWFPRAAAVPFVIGGWIPLFAVLSGVGRRLHAPLILFVLIVKTILPLTLAPDYQIGIIDQTEALAKLTGKKPENAGQLDPIRLNDAVKWWEQANNCDGKDQVCPRPIIVAAAGGASRAGFFTASVIGQLMDDRLRFDDSPQGHGLSAPEITNRVFAFSGVSGSSVAAVMTVAAIAASDQGRQPCTHRPQELWNEQPINSWRGCLEALLAGDFLTPIFTGLVFHDSMRFLRLSGRGWLLEQSWRDHFHKVIGQDATVQNGLACVGSLECPFMTLRPQATRWLPLLVLNGTSVGTGQRIITTALETTYKPQVPCPTGPRRAVCYLFMHAYRFDDLLNGPRSEGSGRQVDVRDVDLSTAALNSARFPLISPPGEIRDRRGNVIDRLVDGGYFENFGVQTATELAQAIVAIDARLNPFVLVLSNDPEVPEQQSMGRSNSERTRRGQSGAFLSDISAPIAAFAHTRNARGTLAVDEAEALLDRANPKTCNIAEIRVWGEPLREFKARDISMSWWLSKPLQIALHEQTDFAEGSQAGRNDKNRKAIEVLLNAMKSQASPNAENPSCPFKQ